MIALFATGLLFIACAAIYPIRALRKHRNATGWDHVYPFTGAITWLALGMASIGSTVSLSNFVVEVFWIAVLSAVIPWGRWLLLMAEMSQVKTLSFLLTLLPIVAAIVIRLTMPTLPE